MASSHPLTSPCVCAGSRVGRVAGLCSRHSRSAPLLANSLPQLRGEPTGNPGLAKGCSGGAYFVLCACRAGLCLADPQNSPGRETMQQHLCSLAPTSTRLLAAHLPRAGVGMEYGESMSVCICVCPVHVPPLPDWARLGPGVLHCDTHSRCPMCVCCESV